jgi:hypothetical protein
MRFFFLALLSLTILVIGFTTQFSSAAESEESFTTTNKVLCVCRCCFHNDCNYVTNASWLLDSCGACDASRCRQMIVSPTTRQRIAKTFDILVNLEQLLSVDSEDRPVMVEHTLEALNENKWDVCEVTAMVETVTCQAAGTPSACQSSADLSAVCFDRNAPVVKFGTWFFLVVTTFGCFFAFMKNHLIGCQEFNMGSFDY